MFRMKTFVLLVLAAGCGLMASVAVLTYLNNAQAQASQVSQQLPTRPVVVAAVDLPPAEVVQSTQLEVVNWPENLIPAGATENPEQIHSRITRTRILKGQPIQAGHLAPEGTTGGLPALIPKGMRAMTVRVNETVGVAGFIRPGNRVDVILTVEGPGRDEVVTQTILQHINVLATGQSMDEDSETTKIARSVTLLLNPEEAERLALAMDQGRIVLSLRNDTDESQKLAMGLDLTGLLPGFHREPDFDVFTFDHDDSPEPEAPKLSEPSPVVIEAEPVNRRAVVIHRGRETQEVSFSE